MTGLSAFLLGVMVGMSLPFVWFYIDWKTSQRRRGA